MKWVLIRHGQTAGNLLGRYIGSKTDEPLCPQGREGIGRITYPPVEKVFSSPMLRCLETARIIYPGLPVERVEGVKECDFGLFENKNYQELKDEPLYRQWLDSEGTMAFPGGESREGFIARCLAAFDRINRGQEESRALITHGGVIMAIMQAYARPQGDYFDFQVKNGQGFILYADGRYEKIGF